MRRRGGTRVWAWGGTRLRGAAAGCREALSNSRGVRDAVAKVVASVVVVLTATATLAGDGPVGRERGPRGGQTNDRPMLIKARKVYLSPGKVIRKGAVLIEDGKVAAVGRNLPVPENAIVRKMARGTITAGLIDANAVVGFAAGHDPAEHESECIPHLRVIDSVDLSSRDFDHLAAAGVTTVYIGADAASVIGAQGAVVRTGGPVERRVVRDAYGVKATVGLEPAYRGPGNAEPYDPTTYLTRRPTTRMGVVWAFRKAFHDAQTLANGEALGTRGEGTPPEEAIPYLQEILRGEMPLRIQARTQYDILTAIRLTDEFGMRFVLEEGLDANRCVGELAAKGIPVIYGPVFDYPSGLREAFQEAERYRYSTPAVLLEAGITVALSAVDYSGEGALPQQAMCAMRFGLSRRQALAAVTTTPAELLGIGDVAGSIAVGRPADLVVWSGEPFEATSRAEMVVIGGRVAVDRKGR